MFRRRALVCRQAVEMVTNYLEGALSRRDQTRLEGHLADCPHCTEYLDQIRATVAAVGRVEPSDLSPAARRDLVALYRQWQAG
jgi:anti-sigma factor RsiW